MISWNFVRKAIFASFFVLTFSFALLSSAYADWVEPSEEPPGGNVKAPVNVSSQGQAKEGGLTVGTSSLGSFTLYSGGTLGVEGATTLRNSLLVQQAADLQNTLNVQGSATFDSTVQVSGLLTATSGIRSLDGSSVRFWVDNESDKVLVNSTSTAFNGTLIVQGTGKSGVLGISNSHYGVHAVATHSYGLYATTFSTSATENSGAILADGAQKGAIVAQNDNADYPVISVASSKTGSSEGTGVAIQAQADDIDTDGEYSYGLYGLAGDITYDSSYVFPKSYGVYGKSGVSNRGVSYAGYFDGFTQVCGQDDNCVLFGTENAQSAVVTGGGVHLTPSSSLTGSRTIYANGVARPMVNENRVLEVAGSVYLSGDGLQTPGSLVLHDQSNEDHLYRVKVEYGVLSAELLSRCEEGLFCSDYQTVIEKEFNGIEGIAGACRAPSVVQNCADTPATPRCSNGECVSLCEYVGNFCDHRDSNSCGEIFSASSAYCGGNNDLVCCTGE